MSSLLKFPWPQTKKRTAAEVFDDLATAATYGSPAGAMYRVGKRLYKQYKGRTTVYRTMPPYSSRRRRYSSRRTAFRRNRGRTAYRKRRTARLMRGTKKALNKGGLMNTLIVPFPKTKKCGLVWNFYQDIDHTNKGSGDFGTRRYNCANPQYPVSGVNPNTTGQARWGDTLHTLYNKYICYGSKLTLRIRNYTSTTTNSNGLMMAIFMYPVDREADALPSLATPYNEMKMSPYRVTPFKLVNTGEHPVTLTATWSLKKAKYFNKSSADPTKPEDYYQVWNPDNATSSDIILPRQWRYSLVVFNQDPADTTGTTKYIIEERVTYYTKWIDRIANNTVAVTPNAMDND